MNGAIAEPFANTSKTPNKTRVITIGASQYFLFCLMNCQSSLTTSSFDMSVSSEHFFVVAGVSLPLGIGLPVRIRRSRAPVQGVPTEQPLDQTNRRHDPKKDNRQNDA